MSATTETLKPCPFCGRHARRSKGGTGEGTYYGTGCASHPSCPARLHGLFHRTQEQADAAWNTRAAPATPEDGRTHDAYPR